MIAELKESTRANAALERRVPPSSRRVILVWSDPQGRLTKVPDTHPIRRTTATIFAERGNDRALNLTPCL